MKCLTSLIVLLNIHINQTHIYNAETNVLLCYGVLSLNQTLQ